ncbi:unnamed protein product [Larinioides sclopetarius]|uniref:Uncharacterized protein n=1 Tax=Larinioides sclopetarius TaxID=280406 RepID=A0AAV1ZZ54_9ARAC
MVRIPLGKDQLAVREIKAGNEETKKPTYTSIEHPKPYVRHPIHFYIWKSQQQCCIVRWRSRRSLLECSTFGAVRIRSALSWMLRSTEAAESEDLITSPGR